MDPEEFDELAVQIDAIEMVVRMLLTRDLARDRLFEVELQRLMARAPKEDEFDPSDRVSRVIERVRHIVQGSFDDLGISVRLPPSDR